MPQDFFENSSVERYYVLRVAPQHELSVKAQLEGKGLEAIVPTYVTRRRWSDRVKTLTLPLFPGYVICRFPADQRITVLETQGVRGAISFASKLAFLETHEIERLQRLVASGLPLEPIDGLKVGTQVRIINGPLAGMAGELAEWHGAARVVVNVHMLHRAVAVQIEPEAVAPVCERYAAIPA